MNDLPIVEPSSGMTRYLRLTTVPDGRPEDAPGAAVLVLAMEMTEEVEERRRVRLMLEERQEEAVQLEEQVARLTAANGELLAANQELTVQNMELSSANEEFLVGNEELQAAAEEVETLNEELQATNEELDTLNEELQATVEELNATNEDLQARSVELQELAVSLEAQRASIDMERSRLQAILANMSDGVLVVDSAGNRILTNAAYDAVFPPGESVEIVDQSGRPIPTDETPEVRARRGETFSMEFGLPGTEGRQRWFEANGSPVHGPDGGGDGVVVIRDISARSLQRLQDEFLATATHELRTPLTVLNGYLSMMRRELERNRDGARLTEYLANAHHQVSRLEGLIRDLADVARLQDGHIQLSIAPVDARDIADRVVQAVRAMGDSPPLALRVPEEPLLVSADAGRLEQVLMNLVTNAVTHASGTDRIDIRLYRDGENAVLCVQDFGPGIAPEHLANLFTRFYRVDTQDRVAGLGLGLYISRELVTAHGGTLTVDSEEGRGTTFTLTLPLAQE
jgi:two-component system CheB/CheR fusion protein